MTHNLVHYSGFLRHDSLYLSIKRRKNNFVEQHKTPLFERQISLSAKAAQDRDKRYKM